VATLLGESSVESAVFEVAQIRIEENESIEAFTLRFTQLFDLTLSGDFAVDTQEKYLVRSSKFAARQKIILWLQGIRSPKLVRYLLKKDCFTNSIEECLFHLRKMVDKDRFVDRMQGKKPEAAIKDTPEGLKMQNLEADNLFKEDEIDSLDMDEKKIWVSEGGINVMNQERYGQGSAGGYTKKCYEAAKTRYPTCQKKARGKYNSAYKRNMNSAEEVEEKGRIASGEWDGRYERDSEEVNECHECGEGHYVRECPEA
jgi:cell division protein YceG involved in septum cleavage